MADEAPTIEPAAEQDATADATPAVEVDTDPEGSEQLGDAGKKALDAMKAKWKAERDQRETFESQNSKLAEELAKLQGREAEWIAEQEKQAAIKEALGKRDAQIVSARIEAAATGRFADPKDALAFIDINDFEVSDDGAVDADAVSAAIADLLERKPHLAAQGGGTPKPDPSQGAGGGAGKRTTAQQFADSIENQLSPR